MPNVSNFGTSTDNAVVQGTVTDRQMVIPDVPPQGLLSVGPRVSFNFIKEPWSEQTSYTFYDVVRDIAGKSYVAIKPLVPAGTPLTDGSYWFFWSDPDAQVEELRNRIQTYETRIAANESAINKANTKIVDINNRIDDLTSGYMVVFGDSFSTSTPDASTAPLWHEILGKKLGLTVKNYAVGGAGFLVEGNTFDTQLATAKTELSELADSVKRVYIYGGWNDVYAQVNGGVLYDKINQFISSVMEFFANAETVLVGPNTFVNSQAVVANQITLTQAAYIFSTAAAYNAIKYIDLHTLGLGNTTFFMQGSNEHPNAYGERMIAAAISQESENYYSPDIVLSDIFTGATGNAIFNIHNFTLTGSINLHTNGSEVTIKLPYKIFSKANLIFAITANGQVVSMQRDILDKNCIYISRNFTTNTDYSIYFNADI